MISDPLDVVVVPFPFSDRPAYKNRPAVIVSSAPFNRDHEAAILAMITTVPDAWPTDVEIRGWKQAGLNVPCKVRFKLFTLDERSIVRRLGALIETDCCAVRSALSQVLVDCG